MSSILLICHTWWHPILPAGLRLRRPVPAMFPPALFRKHWIFALLVCFVEDGVKNLELVAVGLGEEEVDLTLGKRLGCDKMRVDLTMGMKQRLKQKKTKYVFQAILLIMIGASCTTA
jgi:hypothetical protein